MAIFLAPLGSTTRRKAVGARAISDNDVDFHDRYCFLGGVVLRKTTYRLKLPFDRWVENDWFTQNYGQVLLSLGHRTGCDQPWLSGCSLDVATSYPSYLFAEKPGTSSQKINPNKN